MMRSSLVRAFTVSRACSSTADQLLVFSVPLIVYTSTRNVSLSGLALFLEWLPRIISLPIAGSVADRLGGWRVYGFADGVRAAVCLCATSAALRFPHDVFLIVGVLVAITAFFYAQAFIALEATLALVAGPEEMPQAQALVQGIDQAAMIGAPALAALALVRIPPIVLPLAASVLFAISAVLVWSLRSPLGKAHASVERRETRNVRADILVGVGVIRARPFLLTLTALSIMVNFVVGIGLAAGAFLTVGRFGLSNSYYGILQAAVGVTALLSFAAVPRLRKRYSVFSIGMAAYVCVVLGAVVMGSANVFPFFVCGFALAYGSCGLFNVYIRTERIQWIPREHTGKTIGVIVLLNQISLPISGLLVAVSAPHWDVQHLFLIAAVGAFGLYALLFAGLRRTSKTAISSLSVAEAA